MRTIHKYRGKTTKGKREISLFCLFYAEEAAAEQLLKNTAGAAQQGGVPAEGGAFYREMLKTGGQNPLVHRRFHLPQAKGRQKRTLMPDDDPLGIPAGWPY